SNSSAAEPNAVIVDASFVSDAQVAALDVQASTVNTLAMAPQTSGVQTSKLSNTSSDAAALAAAPAQISQLAWFPKPPADKNLDTLAANFDVFILTHKDEPTRDALRAKGVTAPIFQYLRFEAIHDPGSCTATPRGNQAAYLPGDFCDISTNHSDWFLLDSAGKRIKFATDTVTYYRMNPGSQGWREFYARRAGEMKKQFGWDGLFMDHSITGLSTKADIEGFFSYVRNNYSGQLYANISGLPNHSDGVYDRYLDGMLIEAWALGWKSEYLSTSSWNSQLTRAEKIQAAGKKVILVTQGVKTDTAKQSFAYASYMLIANGGASFRYASSSSYSQAWLYPNYNVDMGAPLGARYQVGALWQRDFALGTLIVDPVAHKITFRPKKQIPTLTKTATNLPAQTATKLPTNTATVVPSATPAFTATSLPTSTPVPPTETAAPPTATSIPPTVVPTTDPGATPAPVAGQLCPTWVHDRNTTVAPDNLTYPTWHPQVDPEFGCYFDHEHGADPRTSLADPSLPAFGYINAFVHQDHIAHEPHNGFKVFVVNKGTTNNEGRTATTSTRIVAHMGTGGPARFD
ncbi:MAG: putative glycoside hydrolase, partial [Chloroflexota bacterium]